MTVRLLFEIYCCETIINTFKYFIFFWTFRFITSILAAKYLFKFFFFVFLVIFFLGLSDEKNKDNSINNFIIFFWRYNCIVWFRFLYAFVEICLNENCTAENYFYQSNVEKRENTIIVEKYEDDLNCSELTVIEKIKTWQQKFAKA